MNRRAAWILLSSLALACSHAKSTAPPSRESGTGGSGPSQTEQVRKKAPSRHGTQLAETPAQLRKPNGKAHIVAALRKQGYLSARDRRPSEAALNKAIQRFQKNHGLAATGFADQKTLGQLGLKPEQVDKTQSPRQARRKRGP